MIRCRSVQLSGALCDVVHQESRSKIDSYTGTNFVGKNFHVTHVYLYINIPLEIIACTRLYGLSDHYLRQCRLNLCTYIQ